MAIRRTEHANFTREQVEQHVRESVEIAEACDLTPAVALALLPGIFDKLSSKQIVMEEIGGIPGLQIPRPQG